ncbi:MAG TPA: aminodeoxychorismate synthase component I, partial [Cellulomonas sp.]
MGIREAAHVPWARFDDLRASSAVVLRATRGLLRADRPDDVEPVLEAVEAAAAAGAWAFGFVAYEAASAFDAGLAVHPPVDGLPLAWFGLSDAPVDVAPAAGGGGGYQAGPWAHGWARRRHRQAVEAVRAHIADGDTYQANLTS